MIGLRTLPHARGALAGEPAPVIAGSENEHDESEKEETAATEPDEFEHWRDSGTRS